MCKSQKLKLKSADLYKGLLVGTMLGGLLVCKVHGMAAQEPARLSSLASENLGDTLDHFRKTHREALCRRSQIDQPQSARHKPQKCVTCSVDRNVSFIGYPMLSEVEPEYPFGLTAVFCDRKLVQLSYVLAADSLESLLPTITRHYGVPSKKLTDNDGLLSLASWKSGTSVLIMERTPINSEVYEGEFVRITKTPERFAVTAYIFSQTNEARHPSVIQ